MSVGKDVFRIKEKHTTTHYREHTTTNGRLLEKKKFKIHQTKKSSLFKLILPF